MSDISMLADRYETFLRCLSCNGGPSQDIIDNLKAEWKLFKEQFQEGKMIIKTIIIIFKYYIQVSLAKSQ